MSKPDLSEFEALSQPKGKPCAIGLALEKFDAADTGQLTAALSADIGRITNPAIQEWLSRRGVDTTWQKVSSHRKGNCNCG